MRISESIRLTRQSVVGSFGSDDLVVTSGVVSTECGSGRTTGTGVISILTGRSGT